MGVTGMTWMMLRMTWLIMTGMTTLKPQDLKEKEKVLRKPLKRLGKLIRMGRDKEPVKKL